MNAPQNKMHPLMIVAATSVTLASLVAIASLTGLLPGKTTPASELTANIPPAVVAEAPVAPAASQPVENITALKEKKIQKEKPARHASTQTSEHRQSSEHKASMQGTETTAAEGNPPVANAVTPPICKECGTVENIHEVKVQAEGSGLGAIAGGVLGGLLGNQMGRGTGKTVATVAAAAGGAYAGHQIEKNVRAGKEVEVTVRFDDGSTRTYPQQDANRWRQGDRVRLSNGALQPL